MLFCQLRAGVEECLPLDWVVVGSTPGRGTPTIVSVAPIASLLRMDFGLFHHLIIIPGHSTSVAHRSFSRRVKSWRL